jgi:hypothetical protein
LRHSSRLRGRFHGRSSSFFSSITVSAEGFAHYEEMRQRPAEPAVAIEDDVRRYLDETFKDRFPDAIRA